MSFFFLRRCLSRRRNPLPNLLKDSPLLMGKKKLQKKSPSAKKGSPKLGKASNPKSPPKSAFVDLAVYPSYVSAESSAPSTVVANPTSTPLGATAQDVASATVPSSQEAIVEPEKANHSEISPKSTVDTEKGPIEPASETLALTTPKSDESWVCMVKGFSRFLQKRGDVTTLPSKEVCVKIPNKAIEKHRKSWDYFVLGQFYHEAPTQKLLHNVLNVIWSRYHRVISVTKMEGNSFLIRISNAATRARVIYQRIWKIQGQTMFVAKWEPGVVPDKPEITAAPIWLEHQNVPLQFYNED